MDGNLKTTVKKPHHTDLPDTFTIDGNDYTLVQVIDAARQHGGLTKTAWNDMDTDAQYNAVMVYLGAVGYEMQPTPEPAEGSGQAESMWHPSFFTMAPNLQADPSQLKYHPDLCPVYLAPEFGFFMLAAAVTATINMLGVSNDEWDALDEENKLGSINNYLVSVQAEGVGHAAIDTSAVPYEDYYAAVLTPDAEVAGETPIESMTLEELREKVHQQDFMIAEYADENAKLKQALENTVGRAAAKAMMPSKVDDLGGIDDLPSVVQG